MATLALITQEPDAIHSQCSLGLDGAPPRHFLAKPIRGPNEDQTVSRSVNEWLLAAPRDRDSGYPDKDEDEGGRHRDGDKHKLSDEAIR